LDRGSYALLCYSLLLLLLLLWLLLLLRLPLLRCAALLLLLLSPMLRRTMDIFLVAGGRLSTSALRHRDPDGRCGRDLRGCQLLAIRELPGLCATTCITLAAAHIAEHEAKPREIQRTSRLYSASSRLVTTQRPFGPASANALRVCGTGTSSFLVAKRAARAARTSLPSVTCCILKHLSQRFGQ